METMEEKMQSLLSCGIRCVINLIEPDELDHEGQPFVDYVPVIKKLSIDGAPVDCRRMPIRNLEIPCRDFMVQILDCIDDALGKNLPVYIHCWGGQGRTGTVVGCWLIRHGKKPPEALRQLRELYRDATQSLLAPQCPESDEQVKFILNWEDMPEYA